MKLYAVITTGTGPADMLAVPLACPERGKAIAEMKRLALAEWETVTKKSSGSWLGTMLDDIMDKNENYEIVIHLNSVDYGFAYANGTVRLAVDRILHRAWSVREIGSVELDAAAMADVSEDYEYRSIRTSVEYSFADRFPGADVESGPVRKIIDALADLAAEHVREGCDEDWSVDEAFRQKAKEVGDAVISSGPVQGG